MKIKVNCKCILFGPANRKSDHSMKLEKFGYCILKMYDTCIDGIPLF